MDGSEERHSRLSSALYMHIQTQGHNDFINLKTLKCYTFKVRGFHSQARFHPKYKNNSWKNLEKTKCQHHRLGMFCPLRKCICAVRGQRSEVRFQTYSPYVGILGKLTRRSYSESVNSFLNWFLSQWRPLRFINSKGRERYTHSIPLLLLNSFILDDLTPPSFALGKKSL